MQGEGLGGGRDLHFLKKKLIKLRNIPFQIKGIFDGLRMFEWRTSPKLPNLWLVRFDPISQGKPKREWGTSFSLGKPQNEYFHKTALSRRLLRFHKPGNVVYAQTKESFLSRFLNLKSQPSYDFLKQIELDDMVDGWFFIVYITFRY